MNKETILATLTAFILGLSPKLLEWVKVYKRSKNEDLSIVIDFLKEEVNTLRQRLDEQSAKIEKLHNENISLKVELAILKNQSA